jgi:hypothetical protein
MKSPDEGRQKQTEANLKGKSKTLPNEGLKGNKDRLANRALVVPQR